MNTDYDRGFSNGYVLGSTVWMIIGIVAFSFAAEGCNNWIKRAVKAEAAIEQSTAKDESP